MHITSSRSVSSKTTNQGFSLVEAMVIVTIIGILVTLGYSRFKYHIAKARQGEAKSNLIHITTLQEAYILEHNKYAVLSTSVGTGWKGVGLRRNKTPKEYACDTDKPGEEMLNDLGFRPRNCRELRYEYWTAAGFIGWEDDLTDNPTHRAYVTRHPDYKEPAYQIRADSDPSFTKEYIWPDCDVRDLWRVSYNNSIPEQGPVSRRVLENCK